MPFDKGGSRPFRMPLIPAILPLNNSNNAAESPNNAPPAKDTHGLKSCIYNSCSIVYRLGQNACCNALSIKRIRSSARE